MLKIIYGWAVMPRWGTRQLNPICVSPSELTQHYIYIYIYIYIYYCTCMTPPRGPSVSKKCCVSCKRSPSDRNRTCLSSSPAAMQYILKMTAQAKSHDRSSLTKAYRICRTTCSKSYQTDWFWTFWYSSIDISPPAKSHDRSSLTQAYRICRTTCSK